MYAQYKHIRHPDYQFPEIEDFDTRTKTAENIFGNSLNQEESRIHVSRFMYDVEDYIPIMKGIRTVVLSHVGIIETLLPMLSDDVIHVHLIFDENEKYDQVVKVLPHWKSLSIINYEDASHVQVDFTYSKLDYVSINGKCNGHCPKVPIMKIHNNIDKKFTFDQPHLLHYAVDYEDSPVSDEILSTCQYLELSGRDDKIDASKINPKLLSLHLKSCSLALNLPHLRRLILHGSFCYLGELSQLVYFETNSGCPRLNTVKLTYDVNTTRFQTVDVFGTKPSYSLNNNYKTNKLPLLPPLPVKEPEQLKYSIEHKIIKTTWYTPRIDDGVIYHTIRDDDNEDKYLDEEEVNDGFEVHHDKFGIVLQKHYKVVHLQDNNGRYFRKAVEVDMLSLCSIPEFDSIRYVDVVPDGMVTVYRNIVYVADVNNLIEVEVIISGHGSKYTNASVYLVDGGCVVVDLVKREAIVYTHNDLCYYWSIDDSDIRYLPHCIYTDYLIITHNYIYCRMTGTEEELKLPKYEYNKRDYEMLEYVDYSRNELTKLALDKDYEELYYRLETSKDILSKDMFGMTLLDVGVAKYDITLLKMLVGFGVDYNHPLLDDMDKRTLDNYKSLKCGKKRPM